MIHIFCFFYKVFLRKSQFIFIDQTGCNLSNIIALPDGYLYGGNRDPSIQKLIDHVLKGHAFGKLVLPGLHLIGFIGKINHKLKCTLIPYQALLMQNLCNTVYRSAHRDFHTDFGRILRVYRLKEPGVDSIGNQGKSSNDDGQTNQKDKNLPQYLFQRSILLQFYRFFIFPDLRIRHEPPLPSNYPFLQTPSLYLFERDLTSISLHSR